MAQSPSCRPYHEHERPLGPIFTKAASKFPRSLINHPYMFMFRARYQPRVFSSLAGLQSFQFQLARAPRCLSFSENHEQMLEKLIHVQTSHKESAGLLYAMRAPGEEGLLSTWLS